MDVKRYDYFHAIVDDHSRLVYGELLGDEKATTVTDFTARALSWFAAHGITARRVMTDGAMSYRRNRAFQELLARHGIRHIITPPYTPRWNGKVERFHQTMEREWAKGLRYRNSTARKPRLATLARALQPAQTPQLTRRPTPDQPRSQPLRAGQLADGPPVVVILAVQHVGGLVEPVC
jgi:transposase InsO family protein